MLQKTTHPIGHFVTEASELTPDSYEMCWTPPGGCFVVELVSTWLSESVDNDILPFVIMPGGSGACPSANYKLYFGTRAEHISTLLHMLKTQMSAAKAIGPSAIIVDPPIKLGIGEPLRVHFKGTPIRANKRFGFQVLAVACQMIGQS